MAVIHIEFDYGFKERLEKLSPEDYEELRGKFPEWGLKDSASELDSWALPTLHGTQEDALYLASKGLEPKLKRIRGLVAPAEDLSLKQALTPPSTAPVYTTISVANASLMAVRKMHYLEDSCTDQVQRYLDNGWRIVAVCPPNDCRRPTYILGHFDEHPQFV